MRHRDTRNDVHTSSRTTHRCLTDWQRRCQAAQGWRSAIERFSGL